MGQFDKQPENPSGAAENALRAVTEELQIIQRDLLKSLEADIKRLQTEKIRLADDIKRLQEEKENLQTGRQIGELQALVRQLAQVLANHLGQQLQGSLENLVNQTKGDANRSRITEEIDPSGTTRKNESLQQLDSVDNALNSAFNSLQQELNNYQSSFSQELSRMSAKHQQEQAILVQLVDRLRRELENVTDAPSGRLPAAIEEVTIQPPSDARSISISLPLEEEDTSEREVPLSSLPHNTSGFSRQSNQQLVDEIPKTQSASHRPNQSVSAENTSLSKQLEGFRQRPTGLVMIVLSVIASSIYNVALKAMFTPDSQILGVFELEQLVLPTLGNCLLVLMLRMLVVVPLMLVLAPMLYPRIWEDLQVLFGSIRGTPSPANQTAKRGLILSIVSGCFLFCSQVLLYIAIGQILTGMAIALLFIYLIVSALLSWALFRDRPTKFRMFAIGAIFVGELFVLGNATNTGIGNLSLGVISGAIAGITFAFYVILTRICAARVHPVTFTLINFITMLVLCFFGLMLPLPRDWSLQINPATFLELVLSAFILGVLTLCGYLLNNFGIRKIGATRAAMIGASVPFLTIICAGLIIQETLAFGQIIGVLLVTFGAAAFSWEKIQNQRIRTQSSATTNQ